MDTPLIMMLVSCSFFLGLMSGFYLGYKFIKHIAKKAQAE